MIVECPQCDSKYRVADEKIPDSGGRINCPSCDHKFVVRPDGQGGSETGPVDRGSASSSGEPSRGDARQNGSGLQDMAAGLDETAESPSAPDGDPTEIMDGADGANAPAFVGGREEEDDEQEDATTEMRNPFLGADADGSHEPAIDGTPGEEDPTQIASTDNIDEEFGDDLFGDSGASDRGAGPTEETGTDFGAADAGVGGEEVGDVPDKTVERRGANVAAEFAGGASGGSGPTEPEPESDSTGGGAGVQGGTEPGSEGAQPGPPGREQRESRTGGEPPGPPSDDVPAQPPDDPPGSGSTPAVGPGGPPGETGGAPSPPSDSAPPDPGSGGGEQSPAPNHDGPWKLKAEHGLTYEFPDTDALRDWLIDRDEIGDLELSPDETNFYPLAAFQQVSDLLSGDGSSDVPSPQSQSASSGQSRGGGAPTGGSAPPRSGGPDDAGAAGGPPRQPASSGPAGGGRGGPPQQPQSQGRADADSRREGRSQPSSGATPDVSAEAHAIGSQGSSWTWVLYGVFALLFVVAVGVFLDVSGMYPVTATLFGSSAGDRASEAAESEVKPPSADDKSANQAAEASESDASSGPSAEETKQVNKLLQAAREAIDDNSRNRALEHLNSAEFINPERPEIYELRATIYKQLGDDDKAEKFRKLANQKRSGAAAGPDAGTGAAASDAEP